MNHHANKLIYESEAGNDEVMEALARCPACGASSSRIATMGGA